MKNSFTLIFIVLSCLVYSQDKIPYIDYNTIAEEVVEYSKTKAYDSVLESLNKISKNDSTYCDILTSKSCKKLNEKHETALPFLFLIFLWFSFSYFLKRKIGTYI